MSDFLKDLGDFTVFSSLACAILYFKGFIKNDKAFRIFAIYLLLISLILMTSYFVGRGGARQPNLFLSHYYFIVQFVLLSMFYKQLLGFKWIYWVLITVLILLSYQYIKDPDMYFRYNPLGMTVTQSALVLYSILYFYKCLNYKGEFLLVNIGIFFYLLSSILIFASGNLVFNLDIPTSALDTLIGLNTILYLIFQILIVIEWYRIYKRNHLMPE